MGSMLKYEENVDCFRRTEHVTSILLYGDINAIQKPWITVFIPTYRRAALLQQALDSVLKQWHTDFFWDIVIVDNEPYTGSANATERLIRKIDNPRILYYRNSENLRPGDNFNRGILLARGKWVMMLHDDDLLVDNTIVNMARLINAYTGTRKPLAAITAGYIPFLHNPYTNEILDDVFGLNNYLTNLSMSYELYKNTIFSACWLFYFGNLPSNGTIFNKEAVLDVGGFNENNGICADIILLYSLMKKYSIYSTIRPMGLYRKGYNISFKKESIVQTVEGYERLCRYIYSRNIITRLLGLFLFENVLFSATQNYIAGLNYGHTLLSKAKIEKKDYDFIHPRKPCKLSRFIINVLFIPIYNFHKKLQTKRLAKKAIRRLNNEKNS